MSSEVISRLISELKPHPRNYNNHSDRQVDDLALSLKRFGQRKPIVTWRDMIVAGHGLTMAAQMAGWTSILTMPIPDDWDEATVLAYLAADNELARQADPDLAQLAAITKELEGIDEELAKLAAGGDDALKALMATIEDEKPNGDAEPQIDKAEELRVKWDVQSGQMWQLGEHRIICGDCTDKAVVDRVMGGEKARLCLTDPPYGLGEKKESGKNDYDQYNDTQENLVLLAKKWLPVARSLCGSVVFSPGVTNAWLYPPADWVMCWFYGGGQLISSWGFNCWQPFLCYGKDPSLATGNGGRPDAVNLNTPANSGDLDHPCPKPIALWEWFINRLSFGEYDVLYEPFSGSGTTIIACENLSRKCRAVEISPAYVAVAIQRWVDVTGKEPILL